MVADDSSFDVLDGYVLARGSCEAVRDARLLNSLRAYVRSFVRSVHVAPYVPSSGDDAGQVGPLLVVWCEGGIARRLTALTLACDYLREHVDEVDVEVVGEACRTLKTVLGVQPGSENAPSPG